MSALPTSVTRNERVQWARERRHGACLCATGKPISACETFSERLGWLAQLEEECAEETRRYLAGDNYENEVGRSECTPYIQ